MPFPRATRRATAIAIATVSLGALAASAGATPTAAVERLAGQDRYETARAIALDTFDGATTAYVASGERFPDALAGNGIAGAGTGPILLVERDRVPTATSQALQELDVEEVVILGGTDAVSAGVSATLAEDHAVRRLAGVGRAETAVEIAEAIDQEVGIGAYDGRRAAFLARQDRFADALMVGPLAYNLTIPVLLTQTEVLTPVTAAALSDLDIEVVVIAGGTAAVSDAVERTVEATGVDVIRLAGDDRTETATAVADFAVAELGFGETHSNVARGDKFPDALTGGPHAGDLEMSPILLTSGDSLGDAAAAWLRARCATLAGVDVFGGTAAVSDATLTQIRQAARSC